MGNPNRFEGQILTKHQCRGPKSRLFLQFSSIFLFANFQKYDQINKSVLSTVKAGNSGHDFYFIFNLNFIMFYNEIGTVFVNMLTNVLKVWVNENIKRRRRRLCLLMLFDRFRWALPDQWRKSLKIIDMLPEISLEFLFC